MMSASQADRAIHRPIVLERPAELRASIAKTLAAAQQLEVHEGVDPAVPILGPHAERHHASLIDALETSIEIPEPEGKEASTAYPGERLVGVQHRQTKADRPPVDLR